MFQNFARNSDKVRNGRFWTILNNYRILSIFQNLNEKFFHYNFYANVLLSNTKNFQKIFYLFKKLLFLYNEPWSYIFWDKFRDCILKVSNLFANSKYFFNQNVAKNSRKRIFGTEFLDNFSNLIKLRKNGKNYQTWQILIDEFSTWKQITKFNLPNSVSKRS